MASSSTSLKLNHRLSAKTSLAYLQKPTTKAQNIQFPSTASTRRRFTTSFTCSAHAADSSPVKPRNSGFNRPRALSDGAQSSDELEVSGFVEFITSERVKVVAMLALALALCNADRVVMSVAIVPLSISNGWRQSFAGVVQVQFLNYCLILHFR